MRILSRRLGCQTTNISIDYPNTARLAFYGNPAQNQYSACTYQSATTSSLESGNSN